MERNGSTPGKPPDTPAKRTRLVSHVASAGLEPTPANYFDNVMSIIPVVQLFRQCDVYYFRCPIISTMWCLLFQWSNYFDNVMSIISEIQLFRPCDVYYFSGPIISTMCCLLFQLSNYFDNVMSIISVVKLLRQCDVYYFSCQITSTM